MHVIKKVLNSSVVLVRDDDGAESIVLGKGIGYGKKPGMTIPDSADNQVFVPVEREQQTQTQELLESIDPELVVVTQEIVHEASELLGAEFSSSVYLVLADHLNFAISRMREGVKITNRVFWEIKTYYPDEFKAGLLGLYRIEAELGITLPEEEAANIAFHLANARLGNDDGYDAMRYADAIGKIINLVVLELGRTIDRKSIHYLRFAMHVKFFVERYFSDSLLNDESALLLAQLGKRYPREAKIAAKVETLMERDYGKPITQDELVYLTVHIARISTAG